MILDYGNNVFRKFSPEQVEHLRKRYGVRNLRGLKELTREWAESMPPMKEDLNL